MKYFIDTEFIEGFSSNGWIHKSRHFIDLISIGIVAEDGREYHAISSEYNYKDASAWVKENVITPLYISTVHGDARNRLSVDNFHKVYGQRERIIAEQIRVFCGVEGQGEIEFYGYYADYDWVLFCSLFGTMMDLLKDFPMYCRDLKQTMNENGLSEEWKKKYCPDPVGEHNALIDARWNKQLYEQMNKQRKSEVHWGETLMGDFKPDAG